MAERPGRAVLPDDVIGLLSQDPGVGQVVLTGSRARGRAGPWSDWDFAVGTTAFAEVCQAMPRLVAPLRPVVAQWDRLARTWCYMLILDGPVKVDLIFAQPHPPLPPWQVSAATLPGIDDHFWDWMLWLHARVLLVVRADVAAASVPSRGSDPLRYATARCRQNSRPTTFAPFLVRAVGQLTGTSGG